MPGRDMTGTGRYPPQPKFPPFAFYSCIRLGDPEQLKLIMETDPYYWTQDNGAGAPIHFAVTYKQLDMIHLILKNCPEALNQKDYKGFTALHRAAYLAQYEGYLEIFEYLLSEGADPTILSEDYDPYLYPGRKTCVEVSMDDAEVRGKLQALIDKYKDVPKKPQPHRYIGDWWTIYDYGLEEVCKWPVDYEPQFPEEIKRKEDAEAKAKFKEERRLRRIAAAEGGASEQAADSPVAFLFPGQGSQAVGMLQKCKDIPKVKEMCEKAKEILGYDILDVCINGPKEKLDDTVYSQPALFLGGLAAIEMLRETDPEAIEKCSATAGLSLGEYTALVFAGVLSFEDGLKVVKVRAEAMAAAAKEGDHGMLTVVGLEDITLNKLVEIVTDMFPDNVVTIANYLFPQGRVVSGDRVCLEEVQKVATTKNALKVQYVAVSGAFHSSRMDSAAKALSEVLATVTINKPRIPLYSNVTGALIEDYKIIPKLLEKQLVSSVKWEQTMNDLISLGKTKLYELGPKSQIKSMCKRVDQEVWKNFTNVDVC